MTMRQAKLFSVIVSLIVLGYGAIGFYFLPMASFQGDLTRIGMLPESQFGWRKPQPAVDPKLMQQSSMQDADVLVIQIVALPEDAQMRVISEPGGAGLEQFPASLTNHW